MEHTQHKCASTCPGCVLCDGGLFQCTLCGSAEGQLTTDCPGELVHPDVRDMVYAEKLDYRAGYWSLRDGVKPSALSHHQRMIIPKPFKGIR